MTSRLSSSVFLPFSLDPPISKVRSSKVLIIVVSGTGGEDLSKSMASNESSMAGECFACHKILKGNTTYLYKDKTFCSDICRTTMMTPSSSASSTAPEQGGKPWMIPQFKADHAELAKSLEKEASTPPHTEQRSQRTLGKFSSSGVFRSPSTEFLYNLRQINIRGGNSETTPSCTRQMACQII